MASDARQGPALTITGTCEGCRHLAGTGNDLACRHPDAPPGATPYETLVGIEPTDGCPLLPAARLALARGIVAEADGTTVAALAADECPGKGRCHGAMKWCETCGTVAGTCDDTACDQHDAAHGAGQSEEQR